VWGIAYRTDYDLKAHMEHSGRRLEYTDPQTGKKITPHVIEPAAGINRFFLMMLHDAYYEDKENERVVLKLKPSLAPYQAAVFPLLKNKPDLVAKAQGIYEALSDALVVAWDERGNIGKRYYYQDEIGTPFCVTVDFQTLDDGTVTVRNRDTTGQVRVASGELRGYLQEQLR
jgi:glycyl-tRNA synthetase